jgi:hypothetical protein
MKGKNISIAMMFLICVFSVCHADLTWEYDSPLNVVETITDIGGGNYRYEYSFTNVDTSTIWDFNLYTTFSVQPENTFDGYEKWESLHFVDVDQYGSTYDPRVLDDDIIGAVATSYEYWGWGEMFGIQPNNIAEGLTYLSHTYDPSPKYYSYVTIETSDPDPFSLDKVSAVGQTVPEPSSLVLLGLASLALRRRK